jgi:hypothetical protein
MEMPAPASIHLIFVQFMLNKNRVKKIIKKDG